MKIRIPTLIIPANMKERIEYSTSRPRPLNFCTSCKYVLCSCGRCHSEDCVEPCLYESSSGTSGAAATVGSDGRTWCAECGGNYLPHSH